MKLGLFESFFHKRKKKKDVDIVISIRPSQPTQDAIPRYVERTIETLHDVPEGLPFVSGREYLRVYCADPSIKGGEVCTLYADSEAVAALTRIVAAAEDEQALVARDNGLPRLATYFDCLWGIDPTSHFKGAETDVDNNHAAWLVRKPPTPTGRTPKHPYEVHFNAQDYGQANYSNGTIWYRADGSAGRARMIYWRSHTMYDVRFEASGSRLLPTSIARTENDTKEVLWTAKGTQR